MIDSSNMITVVKWTQKGYASVNPVSPNDLSDEMASQPREKRNKGDMELEGYDEEDSISN